MYWLLIVAFLVILIARAVRNQFRDWRMVRDFKVKKLLDEECELLCTEIHTYPGPRLTTEYIPQNFPSKMAAQEFGENGREGVRVPLVLKLLISMDMLKTIPNLTRLQ